MILYEQVDYRIKNKYQSWKTARDSWLAKAELAEEFYYNDVEGTGTTYTQKQKEKIDLTTGIDVGINFIYPTVNEKLALVVQNKPSHKIIPIDEKQEAKEYAYTLDKFKYNVLYNSHAVGRQEESAKDMLITGIGINGIFDSPIKTTNSFNIDYVYKHNSQVILDANCKDRDMQSAEGFFLEDEYTYEMGKQYFGELVNLINKKYEKGLKLEDLCNNYLSIAKGRAKVIKDSRASALFVIEYWDKVYSKCFFVENEQKGIDMLFEENFDNDVDKLILKGAVESEQNMYWRKNTIIGNYLVYQEIYPLTHCPIKARFFEWGGRPYRSYGMIHYVRGMQEAHDKALQLMLVNGMLTNNAGWTSPVGAVGEAQKPNWEKLGNKPGIMKEYNPVVIDGVPFKPERDEIQPLSNFFPNIMQLCKSGIEYSTGINPMLAGNPSEGKVDVFASLQTYQNSAMKRIELALGHINEAEEALGNVVVEMLLKNIEPNTQYAFFDSENIFNETKIYDDIIKDFKLCKYKVLSIAADALPTQRSAMAIEMMKISQTTPDPMERSVYIKKGFELSDLKGFDEMQEELDTAKKLQGQIQQLQEQIKRDSELMKQYENRALLAEYNTKLTTLVSQVSTNVEVESAKKILRIELEKVMEQLKEAKKGQRSEIKTQ